MIEIQRTDFVAVPTQDLARAAQFYGDTLGLTKNPNSTERWIEFETGNTTLALVSPEHLDAPLRRCRSGRSSSACPTSPGQRKSSRPPASSSRASRGTPAFATAPSSRIPTATGLPSTTATSRIRTGRRPDGGHARRLHPGPGGRHRGGEALLRRDPRPPAQRAPRPRRLDRVRGLERHARRDDAGDARRRVRRVPPGTIALGVADVAAAKAELEAKGLEVGEMWDSGVCNGAGVSDPAGNRILLHHRYKAV